ncbi:hypothetical protein SH668x_000635 [Planctomicrobium sp. SH668]|uniref:hypothetical protein n=1 Tax=Planctomicrobium sp. SH668 TaxID=3448126 RepID=UPI003F5AF4A9
MVLVRQLEFQLVVQLEQLLQQQLELHKLVQLELHRLEHKLVQLEHILVQLELRKLGHMLELQELHKLVQLELHKLEHMLVRQVLRKLELHRAEQQVLHMLARNNHVSCGRGLCKRELSSLALDGKLARKLEHMQLELHRLVQLVHKLEQRRLVHKLVQLELHKLAHIRHDIRDYGRDQRLHLLMQMQQRRQQLRRSKNDST